jgi:hypothetical protein
MIRTLGDGVGMAARSLALPWFFGLRWMSQQDRLDPREVPKADFSMGLAAKVAADEFFLATEVVSMSLAAARARDRIQREISAAVRLYDERGWLDRPALYHRTPPPLRRVRSQRARAGGFAFDHISFDSGYAPHAGEPGRRRFLDYRPNRTAHARLLRHPGPARPWMVCIPGYRMGNATVDLTGFRAGWLHEQLGLNVAIPVLPFHGPRRVGRRGGDGFLTGDFLDTVHAQTQAVWDIRRLIHWLRREGAPAVGLYGLSLGGYTSALVAALEAGLHCVVAGIPASCFVGLARWNTPGLLLRAAERLGFSWDQLEDLLRVVSPLAMPPRVPWQRRFLFAGVADRLAPPEQARDLWVHWERPKVLWYQGSHVSYLVEPGVQEMIEEALTETGVLRRPGQERRRAARSATPRPERGRPLAARQAV